MNRLTQKLYPDSTAVNYTYDNDSRLTQVTDPTGTYQFTFDNMGRLTNTTTSYAFLTGRNFTTSYAYDAASNRTGFTDPESGATSYVYDTLNRLQTLTPPAAFSGTGNFGFTYDALSRRTQMTRPNGLKSVYGYDNLSHLLSVLHQSGSTTIDGATYTVDNAGNRTAKTDKQTNVTSNYGYDSVYQLTQVLQGATTTESYNYDPVGNRTASLGVSSYTTNTSSELTATSSASYGYDLNGNVVTKNDSTGITTYAWDFENRLTSVTLPGSGGTVSFKYDPFGRRIYKSSSNGTSIYAYDGDSLIEETNSSGTAVARYSDGPNIDETLAMFRSSATSYYHADGLGTITSLSNTAGSLAETYTFDSFGKPTNSSGSLTNPFQYIGREFDSETSLYYYRARYYDPGVGRFISEDPTGVEGGMNLFAYTDNNPLKWVDPFGLAPKLPRCPKGGVILSRSELDAMTGPLTQADKANFNRGCVGMCLAYQGSSADYPENTPGTKCFKTLAQAQARTCPAGQQKFIFAHQGSYKIGEPAPTPGPDGEVPTGTISNMGGYYNYLTLFPGGCWGSMNHGTDTPGQQQAYFYPKFPGTPNGSHTVFCSTCKCK